MISVSRVTVATFDSLANGFRSMRIWVLLLLAVLGSGVSTAGFTKVHAWLEEQAEQMQAAQLQAAKDAGMDVSDAEQEDKSLTDEAFAGDIGREALRSLGFKDEERIDRVTKVPLPALFYAMLIFMICPLVSVLIAGPGLAAQAGSGYLRFLVLRGNRLELALAHFKASSLIVLALFLVGALTSFVVSTMTYDGPLGSTAVHLFRAAFDGFFMSLPYIGLACGASQMLRSGWAAIGVLLIALFGVWLLGFGLNIAEAKAWFPETVVQVLGVLFPDRYENPMLDPSYLHKLPWVAGLIALGIAGFFAGFALFRKRDL